MELRYLPDGFMMRNFKVDGEEVIFSIENTKRLFNVEQQIKLNVFKDNEEATLLFKLDYENNNFELKAGDDRIVLAPELIADILIDTYQKREFVYNHDVIKKELLKVSNKYNLLALTGPNFPNKNTVVNGTGFLYNNNNILLGVFNTLFCKKNSNELYIGEYIGKLESHNQLKIEFYFGDKVIKSNDFKWNMNRDVKKSLGLEFLSLVTDDNSSSKLEIAPSLNSKKEMIDKIESNKIYGATLEQMSKSTGVIEEIRMVEAFTESNPVIENVENRIIVVNELLEETNKGKIEVAELMDEFEDMF